MHIHAVMKRKIIVLMVILMTGATILAQTKKNAFKTDLISPFVGVGVFKYERVFNENISIQLGLFYAWDFPTYDDEDYSATGFGITPEFRYYFLTEKPAPVGAYLAINFRYQKLYTENPEENSKATVVNYSPAINLGYQLVIKDILLFDAWAGLAYNFRDLIEQTVPGAGIGYKSESSIGGRFGVSIGLVF
jgi:hypothetical protein